MDPGYSGLGQSVVLQAPTSTRCRQPRLYCVGVSNRTFGWLPALLRSKVLALLLTISLFVYWSIIGLGLISAYGSRKNVLRNALLSPALGAAANVLLIVWVNVAGIPVRRSALPIAATALAGALALSLRWRPVLPIKKLLPFVAVLLAAALLTGYPLLKFGFDWVSFCNDDMANYSLGATYFSHHGFFDAPEPTQVVHDTNSSDFYWYLTVQLGERPGVEENLAWVSSATGLSSHQAFMPTILALDLVFIAATGSLLLTGRKSRLLALLGCAWMAASSLVTLGTVYQLLAQVFGLSLLTAACTLLCTTFRSERRLRVRTLVPGGILCGALGVVYPEVLPFFVLSFIIFHGLLIFRKQESWQALWRSTGIVAAISLGLLNLLAVSTFTILVVRAGLKAVALDSILFPFYLIPSGLAHLWGFYPIGPPLDGPALSICIGAGGVLLIATTIGALNQAWRGNIVAIMCVVMLGLAVKLFGSQMDFGLYKIAMYIQPYLIGTALISWFALVVKFRRWGLPVSLEKLALCAPPLLVMCAGLFAQQYYVHRSLGSVGGGFVEIPRASEHHLISKLIDVSREPRPQTIISDTPNTVLGKFESIYMTPSSIFFTAEDILGRFVTSSILYQGPWQKLLYWLSPESESRVRRIYQERTKQFRSVDLDTQGTLDQRISFTTRAQTEDARLHGSSILQSGPDHGILNRRSMPEGSEMGSFRIIDFNGARDQLLFVSSEFGRNYTSVRSRSLGQVSMYQLEPDFFAPDKTMASMGRESLLRVLNPSPNLRIEFSYTASLNADHDNRIPPISVIGSQREFFAVAGRGSAHFFSPVVQPKAVEGGEYILLDMGTWGVRFPQRRTGLMRLYGGKIPVDLRRIAGFARNLSAVSEVEYQKMTAPSSIRTFPIDLFNRSLEYSGIYEDGWVAEASYLALNQPIAATLLEVRAMVPQLPGGPPAHAVTIMMDDTVLARKTISAGRFNFTFPVSKGTGRHQIRMVFDGAGHLPAGDGRPVSARIEFVGFRTS